MQSGPWPHSKGGEEARPELVPWGIRSSDTGATGRWRGVGPIVSSSSRKVMFDTDVVGELKKLAVPGAVPAGKPIRFGRMQDEATGDAAHDIFGRNVRVVPLLANCLHNVLKTIVGDASLHVIADEVSPGQSPRPFRTKVTPSVHGCCDSLWETFEHGCCSALIGSGVALEAFLPMPASGIRHSDAGRRDEVMAIVAHVFFVLQLVAVFFLKKVDRAIRRRNVPARFGLFLHVVLQEFPQGLTKDHVLQVGDFGAKMSFEKACAMARMKRGCLGWP